MQRLRIARLRFGVSIMTIGFALSLALTGCDSGGGGNPTEQAKTGQAAAQSSMDYMRKHLAESKGAPKTQSKQAPQGR
jgi:hypothetical protein